MYKQFIFLGIYAISFNILADATAVQDGTIAAQVGTSIYNANGDHKPLPMPQSEDTVVKETTKNMGAGDSFGEAFRKASDAASGINSTTEPAIVPETKPEPSTRSETSSAPPADHMPDDHGSKDHFSSDRPSRDTPSIEYIDRATTKKNSG